MIYQHERKESQHKPDALNTSAPPAPSERVGDWELMGNYLSSRDLSYPIALANGCYPVNHRGARIYIPAITRLKGHVYWQARTLGGHPIRWDSPYGPRRDALIVFEHGTKRIVIAEGPMDALAAATLDSTTGIALMGIQPSAEALVHLTHLLTYYTPHLLYPPKEIICVADRDQVSGMLKIQNYLLMRNIFANLVVPDTHKDLACYTKEEREELLSL